MNACELLIFYGNPFFKQVFFLIFTVGFDSPLVLCGFIGFWPASFGFFWLHWLWLVLLASLALLARKTSGKRRKRVENNEKVEKNMRRHCKKNRQTVTLTTQIFLPLNTANSIHNAPQKCQISAATKRRYI